MFNAKYFGVLCLCGTLYACEFSVKPATPPEDSTQQLPDTVVVQEDTSVTGQDTCTELSHAMKQIDESGKIEALNAINTELQYCIPHANQAMLVQWMDETTAMYQRFLHGDTTQQQKYAEFEEYGFSILDVNREEEADTTMPVVLKGDEALFKQLAARDQYLLTHQNEAYIELHYQGEGLFALRRNPAYLKDFFAAALPEEQGAFITRMAKDNAALLYSDAAIVVTWTELVERALFWENYLKQYPKSPYTADAKRLFQEYQYLIFLGMDNTPVSDRFIAGEWINEEALEQINTLAQRQDTTLAKQARIFLDFIDMPQDERDERYPVSSIDDGNEMPASYLAYEQLRLALNVHSPWQNNDNGYRECHDDAICYDVRY